MFTQAKAVTSSNIEAIGYNKEQSILEVRFKNNTSYLYMGVSQTVWEQFSTASSLGSSFHKLILGKYPAVDLSKLQLSELFKHLEGLNNAVASGQTQKISPKAFEKICILAGFKQIVKETEKEIVKEVRRMKPNPRARM